MTIQDQDMLAARIGQEFELVRLDDRRERPSYGYRAVHLIVRVEQHPVEIQVRTAVQDVWAQVFEKLGDRWGRAIRYGGQPDEPQAPIGQTTRRAIVDAVVRLSEGIAYHEKLHVEAGPRPSGSPLDDLKPLVQLLRSLSEALEAGKL